jgi:DnaJ-class molecular chaperone
MAAAAAALQSPEDIVAGFLGSLGIAMWMTKYQLLRVRDRATAKEVDLAYKSLSLEVHPASFRTWITNHAEDVSEEAHATQCMCEIVV